VGKREIEDALSKLDKLTQEEARMASAEVLKTVRDVNDRIGVTALAVNGGATVTAIDDKAMGVSSKMKITHDVKRFNDPMRGSDIDDRVIQVHNPGMEKCRIICPHRPENWTWLGVTVETIRQRENDISILPLAVVNCSSYCNYTFGC
jgi:hypothetical protein